MWRPSRTVVSTCLQAEPIDHPNRKSNVRFLNPQDEVCFRNLLFAVYGDTYSYQSLYQVGGYSNLVLQGKLIGLGEWDSHGILVSHTAIIFKDPENSYVESGLSFRRPFVRGVVKREDHRQVWKRLLFALTSEFGFMHQNTTTLHPLAQRYASDIMMAIPAGIILNYTVGERQRGATVNSAQSMHALMMSTCLKSKNLLRFQNLYLPEGFWGDWLSQWIDLHNLPRKIHRFQRSQDAPVRNLAFETIDLNESIALERCRIVSKGRLFTGELNSIRTHLVHLPCEDIELVQKAFPILLSYGYLPVGFRPHDLRSDEIIFQYFAHRNQLSSLIQDIKLGDQNISQLVEKWFSECTQTL